MRLQAEREEGLRKERRDDRDRVGGRGPDDDERVHVGAAVTRGRDRAAIEGKRRPELHRRREQEEDIASPLDLGELREREIGHREEQGRDGERGSDHEASPQRREVRRSDGSLALLHDRTLGAVLRQHERSVSSALDRAHQR